MKRGEFWTRQSVEGKATAIKVRGYVDQRRGVGYYFYGQLHVQSIWADNVWHAIDLASGMSVFGCPGPYRDFVAMELRINQRLEIGRAKKGYPELCSAFAVEIEAAQAGEGERDG